MSLLACASLLAQQAQAYHAMLPGDRHLVVGSLPVRKEAMRKHPGRKSVAQKVESGMIWVNSWLVRHLSVPFGGMKNSGLGREGGSVGIDEFLETKYIGIKM